MSKRIILIFLLLTIAALTVSCVGGEPIPEASQSVESNEPLLSSPIFSEPEPVTPEETPLPPDDNPVADTGLAAEPTDSAAPAEVSDEPSTSGDTPEQPLVEIPEETPASPPEENPEGNPQITQKETPEPIKIVPDGTKVAYITIDDGPSRKITPNMLDVLADEDVKATFFVLPHNGVDDIYQRILDEGHELANHSNSHVYSKLYSPEDTTFFEEDTLAARDFIFEKFGYTTTAYRFPGGAMGKNDEIVEPRKEFLAENGYRWFDWDLSTGDADSSGKGKNVDALVANVINNIRNRDRIIILMHDTADKSATLEALPIIISKLKDMGYIFDLLQNYP